MPPSNIILKDPKNPESLKTHSYKRQRQKQLHRQHSKATSRILQRQHIIINNSNNNNDIMSNMSSNSDGDRKPETGNLSLIVYHKARK